MEGEISVTTSPTKLVDPAVSRDNLRFSAPKGNTGSVFVNSKKDVGTSGKNMGHELPPGATWFLTKDMDKDINKAWYGVSSLGTQSVAVIVVQ